MALAESLKLGVKEGENKAELTIHNQQFSVEPTKPELKGFFVRYPRTDFQYNDKSAQISVLGGEGVLVLQTSGKDEDRKVNPDVVAKFQCVVVGETLKNHPKVPAGSWYLFYNTGNTPLVGEKVNNSSDAPVDQLERVPYPAFEIVRQNDALALLPTLRVREIKSMDSGGMPYAQQDGHKM